MKPKEAYGYYTIDYGDSKNNIRTKSCRLVHVIENLKNTIENSLTWEP